MRDPAAGVPSARPALQYCLTRRELVRLRAPGFVAAGSTAQLSRERVRTGGGAKLRETDAVRTARQEGTIFGHVLLLLRNRRTRCGNASPSSKWECLTEGLVRLIRHNSQHAPCRGGAAAQGLVLLRHCAMLAGNCSNGSLWAGRRMRSVGSQ